MLGLTHAETHSYPDALILRLVPRHTHTQTNSDSYLLILRHSHCLTSSTHSRLSGCPRRGDGFNTSKGSRQGCCHGPVRNNCVGVSQAVCLLSLSTSLAIRAGSEDVSGGAPVSALPRRAARCVFTFPFAAMWWGCLRRVA
eukprot:1873224-Pyramimonas_sp.AAC.1